MIVATDVGTSTIRVVVGEPTPEGAPTVTGVGVAESRGIRRGVVIDLHAAARGIREAVAEAELAAGVRVTSTALALGGSHLEGLNSRGVVAVSAQSREIQASDVQRATAAARAIALPTGREIIFSAPQEFVVDEQDGVSSPVGMVGMRLAVNLHLVTGSIAAVQNLVACVGSAGLSVSSTRPAAIAAAHALLSEEEKALGVALVDLGGGTTTLAVFDRGALCHLTVLPVGGDHLTEDLAVGLRTPRAEAEKLKRRHAHANASLVGAASQIDVAGLGALPRRAVARRLVSELLQPRIEATLHRLWDEICSAGFSESLTAGVVLTGGGARLKGVADAAAEVFGLPVRIGVPAVTGLADAANTPSLAVGVGLIAAAAPARDKRPIVGPRGRPAIGRMAERLRGLVRSFY